MDGCWRPWLLGCAIDWEAWAAIGSFLAVGAAVWIALASGREQRRREHSQAQVLAGTLAGGLAALLHEIAWFRARFMLDNGENPDRFDGQYHASADFRREVAQGALRLQLLEVERSEHHIHVLPSSVSVPVVKITNLLRRIHKDAALLSRNGQADVGELDVVEPNVLRKRIEDTRQLSRVLRTELVKLAGLE